MNQVAARPSAQAPDLSVLIPIYGPREPLVAVLEGLAVQTLAPERFEVVVVDDGTPEPIELDAERYPFALTLLRQENAGPGAARNRGLDHCRAPMLLILNADALPAKDLLERHLTAQAEAPERCAVLGTFHFTQQALKHPFVQLLDCTDLLFAFTKLQHGELYDWQYFWTCNISLPVDALREVGGFDAERFREAIAEDVELGYRLEKRGWRVFYREDCRCEHDHVIASEAYFRRAIRLGVNLIKMWEKHKDPRILWCESEAAVSMLLAASVTLVESYQPVLGRLESTLAALETEHRGRVLSHEQKAQAAELVRKLGIVALHRGYHMERTGIDVVQMGRQGAPAGELTSVVVVSCGQLEYTRRCIEALRAAREEAHPIELIVVDNGSTDGSAEWLAAQDDLTLIANAENLGAPRARNQATARARGEWIAYLDNDVFVPPGWLGRALYHGAVDPRVGAVALVANRASKFQQVPYEGTDDPVSIATHAEERFAEYARRGMDTDLFTSLGVLVRREVVDQIGGFDERFSPWGFEDDDLSLRVRFAGWRNRVALDTFVYHAPYPDSAKHERHSAHLHANWEQFARKWGRGGPAPKIFDYGALGISLETRVDEQRLVFPLPVTAGQEAAPAPSAPASLSAARRAVLVLGSGRSGTSMVAGTLAEAGWYVGDEPYGGRDSNPKGFFETAEINGVNEALLADAFPHHRLARMQRWLTEADASVPADAPAHLVERMRRLAETRPFAFKDPRFCYTLPAWRAALGELGCVCVFRAPAINAESTVRECASQDYLAGVEVDFERALRIWCAMYRQVLERHRHEGEWLFLHYDQLFTPEGLEGLEAFVGAPVQRDFPEGRYRRTASERPVSAEAGRIYAELCELAGYAAEPIAVESPSVPEPVDPPELSVIVCTYQRRDTLERCLRSFEEQTAGGRYELIVVNDGSTDGTRELLEGWDFRVPARVVHRENGGLSAARNSGIAVARGEFLLLVNDDTIAHEGLVEQHLAAHAREAGEVAVLGSFEQPPEVLSGALMRVLEDDTLVFCFSQLQPGGRHDWNAFWTCNVSVPAEAVRAVGGFDETFRHYGCEDTDLGIRLYERGLEVVYEPRARATHDHLLDLDDLIRRNRTTAKAWVRLFRKHPAAMDHRYWRSRHGMTLESLERTLVAALPERPLLEASVRTLSRIDLGALERTGREGAALARSCEARLRAELRVLNQLWWAEGQADGLREFGVASFEELFAPPSDEPWPLATDAPRRLLAWPRYDAGTGDLERLLGTWAQALASDGSCLCLRHDEAFDGPLEDAMARIEEAYAAAVDGDVDLDVLVVDGAMGPEELQRLGRAVETLIEVPGCDDSARAAFAQVVGVPRLSTPVWAV